MVCDDKVVGSAVALFLALPHHFRTYLHVRVFAFHSLLGHLVNLPSQKLKCLIYKFIVFCASLDVTHTHPHCQSFSLSPTHHAFLSSIELGAYEQSRAIFCCVVVDLCYPLFDVVEGGTISEGKCEKYACGTAIVRLSDVFEAFLPSCVPNLHFQRLSLAADQLRLEINPNRSSVRHNESILSEARDECSFSNASISNNQDFGKEIMMPIDRGLFLILHQIIAA